LRGWRPEREHPALGRTEKSMTAIETDLIAKLVAQKEQDLLRE